MNEVLFDFNGKQHRVKVEGEIEPDVVEECLNYLNNNELFDYIYNFQNFFFEEVNQNEDFFDGQTINSGLDLKESIEEINLIKYVNGVVYVCGEFWCDPEHGFSFQFPGGKFVKSEHKTFNYERDLGKKANNVLTCTILGNAFDCM